MNVVDVDGQGQQGHDSEDKNEEEYRKLRYERWPEMMKKRKMPCNW